MGTIHLGIVLALIVMAGIIPTVVVDAFGRSLTTTILKTTANHHHDHHHHDGRHFGAKARTSLSSSTSSSSSLPRLRSSSFDDDELSKLISKRSQIKRKKKEELPNPVEEDDLLAAASATTDGGIDPEEILSNMDVEDYIPEFETKRPVRRPKTNKDDDEDDEKKTASGSNEPDYVDYMSDYEDENEFHIPNRIGISTQCWGDETKGFVASGKLKKQQLREGKFVPGDLQLAYNELMKEGVVLFETSPLYGKANAAKQLSAHDILARCMKEYSDSDNTATATTTTPLLVDTFANRLWQRRAASVNTALTDACDKLGVAGVDVYEVQNMGWLLPSGGILKGMADAIVDQGTANYVGVRNVSPLRMRRLMSKLEKQDGLTLTSNSFEFSLVNRKSEKLLEMCKVLGVVPLVRNPLGSGLASGQYTASNPSGGIAGASAKFSFDTLEKLQPLHSTLESVAERVKTRLIREMRDVQERNRGRYGGPPPKINTDITTTQVALNYVVSKGGVPLAEVNSPKQAQEVIGCLGWTLTDAEVSMLELAAEACRR